MNKKVLSYLNTMGENKTPLTYVFRFYASGEMKDVLLQQRVKKLEFFPSLQKSKESLQMSFQYYNLYAILEFSKTGYEYSVYTPNCSAKDFENNTIQQSYSTDFSIESFLVAFMRLLNSDPRLIKASQVIEKGKRYKVISSICLGISLLIIAIPSVYVLITGNTIQLGPWFLAVMLVPFVISQIFDFLSVRN